MGRVRSRYDEPEWYCDATMSFRTQAVVLDMDARLTETEARVKALTSSSPNACVICGYDGNKDSTLKVGSTWAHAVKGKLICNACFDLLVGRSNDMSKIIGLANASVVANATSVICANCALEDFAAELSEEAEFSRCKYYGYRWAIRKKDEVLFPGGLDCPQCGRAIVKRGVKTNG